MSHFTVTVVVPKDRVGKEDYLDRVLAPYDENMEVPAVKTYLDDDDLKDMAEYYKLDVNDLDALAAKLESWSGPGGRDEQGLYSLSTRNPESKWDWWEVGGRWTGYFKVKPGVLVTVGRPGVGHNQPKPGYADIVTKGGVDWEGMAYDAANEARTYFQQCKADGKPLSDLTEEEYVLKHSRPSTFAMIDKDGKWHQSGQMGWFGMSSGDMDPKDWADQWVSYIGSCDEDDVLVVLDCHI